jgi:hypothetical protein
MERELFKAFLAQREKGRLVRRGWLEGRPDVCSGKSMAPTTKTCLFSPPDGSSDFNVAGDFHVEPWPIGRPVSLKSTAVSSSIGFDLTGGTLSHSYHP